MVVKNFSHGELFMLGGYVMFYVTMVLDLPWPIGVAAAALVLLVVGMLIERTLIETLRRRAGRDWQLDAFVLTIGMLVIMQNLALIFFGTERRGVSDLRSEEHTSELQSLMRISYAVFCLKKKKTLNK